MESVNVPFTRDDVDAGAYRALRGACLRLGFLPSFRHGILLDVAMVEPDDAAATAGIRALTHQEVRRFGISRDDFDRAVADLEADGASRGPDAEPECAAPPDACPESWDAREGRAREVAERMVRHAFGAGASDLLLDDQEEWMDVAILVAGRKEILPPVDRLHAPALIRAFKEMGGISTHAAAGWQSGAASVSVGGGRRADLRIEVGPTARGQGLVARLQDRDRQLRRMERLPFDDPEQAGLARACLGRRQGLIVATGPTGHGKTSTLYACVGQLDRSALNIRTLEDPVEFAVPWITQVPVGTDTGLGFGDGLRSLLRQAPHVILMGEIRDAAAARACMEAADTGHLILATLHTRDAVGVVSRLLDLGVTGRQAGASLVLAIGQRLAPRLCPHCRREEAPTPRLAARFAGHGLPAPGRVFRRCGCPRCGGRGENGVVPVFELFHPGIDGELAEMICGAGREGFRESALRKRWIEAGGSPLAREALKRAASGDLAAEEALALGREIDA
jgi:type II secretory ATPase GspE/PulE/Tfp pilus assembly ATPase PilB-like protein